MDIALMRNIGERNNVQKFGSGSHAMLYAHGFGSDQSMWKTVAQAFRDRYRIILFDLG